MKNLLILYHVEYYTCMRVVLQFQTSGSTFLGFKNTVSQFSCNINALLGIEVEEIEKILNLGTVVIHQQKLLIKVNFSFFTSTK